MISITQKDDNTEVRGKMRDFVDFGFDLLKMDEGDACDFLLEGISEERLPDNLLRLKVTVENLDNWADEFENPALSVLPRLLKLRIPSIVMKGQKRGVDEKYLVAILKFMTIDIDSITDFETEFNPN